MSPKRFSVTITSKAAGRWISIMAQLSTNRCSTDTSGYSSLTSSTMVRRAGWGGPVLAGHIGVFELDLVDNGPPQPARRQDVGLVHAGQLLPPAAGEIERQLHDALDLVLGVGERIDDLAPGCGFALLRRLAEVEPAGQLAHDHHVDAFEQRFPYGRAAAQDRLNRDRPKVRI